MSRKLTIEQMQAIAKEWGGNCISKKYVDSKTKLEWECSEGHRWKTKPNTIKNGHWCLECAGLKKLTIGKMQAIAKELGGKCLSKKYVNNRTKLEWECSEGHRWKSVASHIRNKSWCPKCAGKQKRTIEEIQDFAKSRGGKCLSKEYVNNHTKLEWECSEGHRWKARPTYIQDKENWCPLCVNKERMLVMQTIAKSRNGKCLSKKYEGDGTKLEWECSEGHRWWALPNKVAHKRWCPDCGGSKKLTLEHMQTIAKSRGGKCLSKKYVNNHTKLEWECAHSHRWKTSPMSIKTNGTWCPECSTGISERICRAYFRQLFERPFPKSRPRWLKNSAGNQMELDGYCKDLRIAFEHQGEQHYTTTSHYVTSEDALLKRKKYDEEKNLLCNKKGIRLIAIPSLFSRTKLEDLQYFIFEECKRLHIRRPAGMLDKKINLKSTWATNTAKQKLEELQAIAKSLYGRCLSKMYINTSTKLEWECAEGHRWKATPGKIKNMGTWCPDCWEIRRGQRRKTV